MPKRYPKQWQLWPCSKCGVNTVHEHDDYHQRQDVAQWEEPHGVRAYRKSKRCAACYRKSQWSPITIYEITEDDFNKLVEERDRLRAEVRELQEFASKIGSALFSLYKIDEVLKAQTAQPQVSTNTEGANLPSRTSLGLVLPS